MLGNIGHVHWLFLAEDLQIHIFILSQNSHFIALAPYFIAGSHRWSLVREPTAPQSVSPSLSPQSASPSPSPSPSPHHSLSHHNHTSHRHCTTVCITLPHHSPRHRYCWQMLLPHHAFVIALIQLGIFFYSN